MDEDFKKISDLPEKIFCVTLRSVGNKYGNHTVFGIVVQVETSARLPLIVTWFAVLSDQDTRWPYHR